MVRNSIFPRFSDDFSPEFQVSQATTAIFFAPQCLKHFVPKWHYEKPERLQQVMKALVSLCDKFPCVKVIQDFPSISKEDLLRAHNASYIEKVRIYIQAFVELYQGVF